MRKNSKRESSSQELSAKELGLYLSKLSSLNRNEKTGNLALSHSLDVLSSFLIQSRAELITDALPKMQSDKAKKTDLPEGDIASWTKEDVVSHIETPTTTRQQLISIGKARFGIPSSRLQKLSREEILRALFAVIEHEQSIEILSDQAKIGGENRNS